MARLHCSRERVLCFTDMKPTGKLITGGNNVKMVNTEVKAQKKLFGDYVTAKLKLALFGEEALGTSSSTENERKEEKAKNKKKDKKNKKDKDQKKNKEKKYAHSKVVNEESKKTTKN